MLELDSEHLKYHPRCVRDLLGYLRGETDTTPEPLTIELSPVRRCNFRCVYCALDYRLTKLEPLDLPSKTMGKLLGQVANWDTPPGIVWAGEGEPTLHPDLPALVLEAARLKLRQGMSTNGSSPSVVRYVDKLTWIRFTVDAADALLWADIHGVANPALHASVFDTIAKCVGRPGRCTIGIQAILCAENAHNIGALAAIGKEIGVDYVVVKPYSRHPKSIHSPLTPPTGGQVDQLLSRLAELRSDTFEAVMRGNAADAAARAPRFKRCHAAPLFLFVDAEGLVYPCVQFVGDRDEALGSLEFQTITEILNCSGRKDSLITDLTTKRHVSDCRRACRLYAANEYLEELLSGNPHHAFI